MKKQNFGKNVIDKYNLWAYRYKDFTFKSKLGNKNTEKLIYCFNKEIINCTLSKAINQTERKNKSKFQD